MHCHTFHRPAVALAVLLLCAAAWADQDDDDADLKPTLEEAAKASVLKRWPNAKEIEVVDLTEDVDDEEIEPAPLTEIRERVEADGEKIVVGDVEAEVAEDVSADYTLSVTFESGGRDIEALMDDAGAIKFVYEAIPFSQAPGELIDAALRSVKSDDLIYFDKMLDETQPGRSVQSYIIGVGDKDVYLDAEGEVTAVEDAPEDEPVDEDAADAAGVI